MKPITELTTKGIELVSGILVGFLTWFVTKDEPLSALLSGIVGLLTSIVLILLIEFYRLSKEIFETKHLYSTLIDLLKTDKIVNSKDVSIVLKYGLKNISEDDMAKIWIDFSWTIKQNYETIVFLKPDKIYSQNWTETAIDIQKAKVRSANASIKKVFVVENEDELKRNLQIFEKQLDLGLDVRVILLNAINEIFSIKSKLINFETIDFMIFDKRVLLKWNLSEREFTNGELSFDKTEIEDYHDFFIDIFQNAHEVRKRQKEVSST